MGVPVGLRLLKQVMLNLIQQFFHLLVDLIQRHHRLLMGISAHQHCLAVLNISRADFHADRNSSHLRLAELPARALVGVVHFHPEIGQSLLQLKCLVQHARLLLLNGNDHHLYGSDGRGKHQTVVVAVNHDDGSDQTGGHAPGSLMDIF